MTQEQFNRAVEISYRIDNLKETLKHIENTSQHRLFYAYKTCNGDYTICPDWAMRNIYDILDRHDLMIRKEIRDEIESLTKEIETL